MTIVQAIPAPGQTPLDEMSVPIPAEGIPVLAESPYYAPMFMQGVILRREPARGAVLEVITGVDVAGALVSTVTAQLSSRPGAADGEIVTTSGFAAYGDGGGSTWRFALGVSAGANDVDKRNTSNGQWQIVWDGCVFQADWAGVPRDGVTNASAGLAACLAINDNTFVLQLGPGNYRTTGKLTIPTGKTLQGAAGGDAGMHTGPTVAQQNSSVIVYDGPNATELADCAIQVGTAGVLRDLIVIVAVGKTIKALVGYTALGGTAAHFDNVGLHCLWGSWASGPAGRGTAEYGYMIGVGQDGNCDYATWDRGFVRDPLEAAFGVPANAQPYSLEINHMRLDNFLGFAFGTQSHGSVFKAIGDSAYITVTLNSPCVEHFACLFEGFAGRFVSATINQIQWEGMKRIWDQAGFAGCSGTIAFVGGRLSTLHLDKVVRQSDGTTERIAASDKRLIRDGAGIVFDFAGCNIGAEAPIAGDRGATFEIAMHSQFVAHGCTFPTIDPIVRLGLDGVFSSGGTWLIGCKGFDSRSVLGGNYAPVPARHGCDNPDGVVVIEDTDATGPVVFGRVIPSATTRPEQGQNGVGDGPRYIVQLTVVDSSGAPAAGSKRASVANIDENGFDIELEAAPGAGEYVTVAYSLALNPQGLVS